MHLFDQRPSAPRPSDRPPMSQLACRLTHWYHDYHRVSVPESTGSVWTCARCGNVRVTN